MPTLYTIGHSTHLLQEFLAMLESAKINLLVDVRTIPKSRRMPWFNDTELSKTLPQANIHYLHMPKLGGLRKTNKDSINQGWENLSFRGFADYMQTADFFNALKNLNQLIKKEKKVAIMCAEALPWRCHRSLISDAEVSRGVKVLHIMSRTQLKPHVLTSFAVVDKNKRPIKVYYP